MKVISFCIYGSKDKYCKGLDENLKLIQSNLPDYNAFIYVGDSVPEHWIDIYKSYSFVRLIETKIKGMYNRCQRFLAIDQPDVNIMIVRDTDSRLHERDIWCIKHFENSNYLAHAIRDHPEHGINILAGLWGIKKNQGLVIKQLLDEYLQINSNINYVQYDQYFLRDVLYPLISSNIIVYVFNERMRINVNEQVLQIPLVVTDDNFCGLAIDFDSFGNEIKEYKWNFNFECNQCKKFCGPNKCGKCRLVTYCSKQCQVVDWKSHKLNCYV